MKKVKLKQREEPTSSRATEVWGARNACMVTWMVMSCMDMDGL